MIGTDLWLSCKIKSTILIKIEIEPILTKRRKIAHDVGLYAKVVFQVAVLIIHITKKKSKKH